MMAKTKREKDSSAREQDPPSFVSTGTSGDSEDGALREMVRRIAEPIFKAAIPLEAQTDIMDISAQSFKVVWRPNNYRRRGLFKEPLDIPSKQWGGVYHHFKITLKGLLMVRDYPQVLLIVGPRVIQAVYSQRVVGGVKEAFLIERRTMQELEDVLVAKREAITGLLDGAVSDFCARVGCVVGPLSWGRYEDWVKGESVIDSLPQDLVIHDTFFKKVYGEGIEFKSSGGGESPVVHLKQYIKNRAIEDVAPEIARELALLAAAVRGRGESAASVLARVRVFPNDLLSLADEVLSLSAADRVELSLRTFERFGG